MRRFAGGQHGAGLSRGAEALRGELQHGSGAWAKLLVLAETRGNWGGVRPTGSCETQGSCGRVSCLSPTFTVTICCQTEDKTQQINKVCQLELPWTGLWLKCGRTGQQLPALRAAAVARRWDKRSVTASGLVSSLLPVRSSTGW